MHQFTSCIPSPTEESMCHTSYISHRLHWDIFSPLFATGNCNRSLHLLFPYHCLNDSNIRHRNHFYLLSSTFVYSQKAGQKQTRPELIFSSTQYYNNQIDVAENLQTVSHELDTDHWNLRRHLYGMFPASTGI
jgi:hypothetical protein